MANRLPAEWEPHKQVWMAYVAKSRIGQKTIWGTSAPRVRRDVARLALEISAVSQVTVLVTPEDLIEARSFMGSAVSYLMAPLDDLWIRDTGPLFVHDDDGTRCIEPGFNGWGGKQPHANDARVAQAIAEALSLPLASCGLVLEGGSIEVDGRGTALVVERTVINDNRNPGLSRSSAQQALSDAFGISKVIWLDLSGTTPDITDGHVDHYARFIAPAKVVVHMESRVNNAIWDEERIVCRRIAHQLRKETDATGAPLQVIELPGPKWPKPRGLDAAASYVNFLMTNGAVFLPSFEQAAADQQAVEILSAELPEFTIRTVGIKEIVAGGGGIHCATMSQPCD